MKKLLGLLLLAVAMLGLSPGRARAQSQPTFEIGYTTWTTVGVPCSTGTAIQLNGTRPTGFVQNVAGYFIQNQDATDSIWLGDSPSVSTHTATAAALAALGLRLIAGDSYPIHLSKRRDSGIGLVPIYCKAADAAGTSGAAMNVTWFGF